MKNQTKLLFFSTVLFVSCSDNKTIPEPVVVEPDPVVVQEPIRFTVTETKEPFVLINDRGFEAMLIYYDIDSDNQINGKVSQADLEKVVILTNQNTTNYQREKRAFVEKEYNGIPKIVSFNDVQALPNLKILEGYGGGDHLDLTHNRDLEEIQMFMPAIKTIDLKNLKKLKKIDFYPAVGVGYWPLYYLENIKNFKEIDISDNVALEIFKYYASAPTFDLSKNVNLRELYLTSRAYKDTVLDLSHNKALEIIDCTGLPSVKEILVSKEVIAKINEELQSLPVGSYSMFWKKPEGAVWKVKTL